MISWVSNYWMNKIWWKHVHLNAIFVSSPITIIDNYCYLQIETQRRYWWSKNMYDVSKVLQTKVLLMFYQHPPCVCLLAWQLDDQREKNKRRLLYVLLCATAVLYTRTKGHIWHMVFSKEIFLIIFVCIIPALSDILMTRNRKKGEIYFMQGMTNWVWRARFPSFAEKQ